MIRVRSHHDGQRRDRHYRLQPSQRILSSRQLTHAKEHFLLLNQTGRCFRSMQLDQS